MKVLFINRMAGILRGGGETFDLEMARHLDQIGCDVSFLYGLPMFGSARSPVDRPRAQAIRSPYFGDVNWDRIRGGWRIRQMDFKWFEDKATNWAAQRIEDFDLLQVCELPRVVANWKKRGLKKPVVMRMTSPLYYDPVDGVGKADAVIASGTTLAEFRKGIREDCIDIPNGVDLERFHPGDSDFRKRRGWSADELLVLFVARLIPVKNHRMLLDAFRRLLAEVPKARLVLVGDGMERSSLEEASQKFQISARVHFLGEIPFEAVPEIYRAADIKVISSDYESFSFTTLEGMATGLPLVVTDTQWVPSLIGRDRGGMVVPKGNAEAFAAALKVLAEDPARRVHLGQWNREQVESNYGWQASARKLKQVYEHLLAG